MLAPIFHSNISNKGRPIAWYEWVIDGPIKLNQHNFTELCKQISNSREAVLLSRGTFGNFLYIKQHILSWTLVYIAWLVGPLWDLLNPNIDHVIHLLLDYTKMQELKIWELNGYNNFLSNVWCKRACWAILVDLKWHLKKCGMAVALHVDMC